MQARHIHWCVYILSAAHTAGALCIACVVVRDLHAKCIKCIGECNVSHERKSCAAVPAVAAAACAALLHSASGPHFSILLCRVARPGQVFKLSRGGLARHNFPYADLPAFIAAAMPRAAQLPIKTNECVCRVVHA